MKIVIASSKTWFSLNEIILKKNKVLFIKNKKDLTKKKLESFKADIIFFPHWNWKVSETIFKNFKCILFHTAPLPYGRGGSPIQNLIINGFKKTPVCAIKLNNNLDSGDIYSKLDISLSGSLTDIFEKLNIVTNKLILKILKDDPKPKPQKGKIFKFKRLVGKDNLIPKNLNIKKIYDRIRMLDHKDYPNAYIKYCNYNIEFFNAKLEKDKLYCKVKLTTEKN